MNSQPSSARRSCFRIAGLCGLLAAVASAVGAVLDPEHFFPGYLVAAVWIWSLSVGGLMLASLFHLTGGRWGEAGRGWFEVAARSMPLVACLFIPLAFGLPHLYPWSEPDFFSGMEKVSHRQWYYTADFFLLRSAAYFGIWIVLSLLLAGIPGRRSRRQPRSAGEASSGEQRPVPGGRAVAGLSAVALLLTVTWSAFDWLMSLDPMFGSSIFGALVGVGAMLSGFAFVVAGVTISSGAWAGAKPESGKAIRDLANLLLAMVMLWAYFAFSQFLLIWSGNLPEEAKYYLDRSSGGWQALVILLAVGGFVIPLGMLMSARVKQSPRSLAFLALWLIVLRALEVDWFVLPHFSPGEFSWNGWAFVAPIAVGGLLLAFVVWDGPGGATRPAMTEEHAGES